MRIREKIKKVSVLCLIFLLSINSFATSISNNDGSAFITKAEFDALKSSFQAQIDTYNQSIDSKIDGAIASYLAGINVKKEQECPSLINQLSNFFWVKNWTPVATHLGTSGQVYIVAKWHFNNNASAASSGTHYSGTDTNLHEANKKNYSECVCAASNSNRDTPTWMTVPSGTTLNDTTKTLALVYRLNDLYSTTTRSALSLLYLNKSYPQSQLVVTGTNTQSGVDGSSGVADYSTVCVLPSVESTYTTWGSYNYSCAVPLDGAGNTGNLVGIAGWQQHDESVPLSSFYYALPDKKYTDSNLVTIHIDELNKIGDQRGTFWSITDAGNKNAWLKVWQYYYTLQRSGTTLTFKRVTSSVGGETTSINDSFGVYLHEHKVNKEGTVAKNYKVSNICLEEISGLVGEFVTYGDGLPLFKANMDGRVKFTLDTGCISNQLFFEIRKGKFGNTNLSGSTFSTLSDRNPSITKGTSTATNTKWTVEFDVKEGETYWIMCAPQDANKVYVETKDKIVITKED